MRIEFPEDNSYIEMTLNNTKVVISVGAKDPKNVLNFIVNSAEISLNELSQLVSDLKVPLPPIK